MTVMARPITPKGTLILGKEILTEAGLGKLVVFMKLDEITRGNVYVDTNVLYMYLRADPVHLPTTERFLQRVVCGDITAGNHCDRFRRCRL